MKLTWPDLLIEDVSAEEFDRWISEWRGVIRGEAAVAFLNKFGVWFLRRPDGSVDMLNVFTGEVERVAASPDAFGTMVNKQAWQETYLLSELVYALHQEGKVPGRGECYAVAPHPAFGGPNPMAGEPVATARVMTMSVAVWQSLCAQSVRMTDSQ